MLNNLENCLKNISQSNITNSSDLYRLCQNITNSSLIDHDIMRNKIHKGVSQLIIYFIFLSIMAILLCFLYKYITRRDEIQQYPIITNLQNRYKIETIETEIVSQQDKIKNITEEIKINNIQSLNSKTQQEESYIAEYEK